MPPPAWVRDDPASVCAVWAYERDRVRDGAWSGSADACATGDNPVSRQEALDRINLMRWLAWMPSDVVTDDSRDLAAQQCAVMMDAQGALDHYPGASWSCRTDRGSEAAAQSVLASAPAAAAIDLFLIDAGNADTLGHRRWLLSNELAVAGIGSTEAYSCVWVTDGGGSVARDWIAWPPPGPFPAEALTPSPYTAVGLNETGWTVQSDTLDLTGAKVEVWEDGTYMPVFEWTLAPLFGSVSAVAFRPEGWTPRAGSRISVLVTAGAEQIWYEVDLLGCDD